MKSLVAGFITVVFAVGISCVAEAGTVTIGTDMGFGNGFPFESGYQGQYQQDYDGAFFHGPVDITAITFFLAPSSAPENISGDFNIDLSTTNATTASGAGSLSRVYADNIGSDNARFFSGTVADVLTFSGGPFLYDPSKGNLLLDVRVLSAIGTESLAAGCSPDTNRIFNLGGNGAPTRGGFYCGDHLGGGGLQTEFTFAPASVPEPASLALLGAGLVCLGAVRHRRNVH